MKNTIKKYAIVALATFAVACGGDDDDNNANNANNENNQNNVNNTNNANNVNNVNNANNVNNTNNVNNNTGFDFRTDAADAYTRVDRMGMPAVSTALLTDKDAYNDANPADDANGDFVTEIVTNLTALHGALDDDIDGAGLTACVMDDTDNDSLPDCVGQEVLPGGPTVAGLVLPDTLKIDPAAPAGFPNGRQLEDPVMDVILSVIFLDMTVHGPTTLVGILNPAANDVAFPGTFPYVAAPN